MRGIWLEAARSILIITVVSVTVAAVGLLIIYKEALKKHCADLVKHTMLEAHGGFQWVGRSGEFSPARRQRELVEYRLHQVSSP